MSEERIEVIAYSGHRGEETPRVIVLRQKKIEVVEILSRWIEENAENRNRRRFFIFKASDGILHKIFYDEKTMEWYEGMLREIR
jgi:hypothetical protein